MVKKSERKLMEEDTRNLVDEFKGMTNEEVKERLARRRSKLEVAIENVEHDFNIGTIVRNANAFNVAKVHIIGKKKYNRRGAMCTDKYLEMVHWSSVAEFYKDQQRRGRKIIAIENNVERAVPLTKGMLEQETTLVFGSESNGLSAEMLNLAVDVYYIESFGSTRSVNVGVASGIAMYEWIRKNVIEEGSGIDEE